MALLEGWLNSIEFSNSENIRPQNNNNEEIYGPIYGEIRNKRRPPAPPPPPAYQVVVYAMTVQS